MDGTKLARRYLPLALLLALQAVVITFVPSTAQRSTASLAQANQGDGGSSGTVQGAETTTGGSVGSSTGGATGAVLPGGQTSPTTGGTSTGTTGTSGTSTGDTKHCVSGRQFDPRIDYFAPPCTPTFTGNNRGGTYQGVSKDRIEVVWYITNYGAETNAVLKAQNQYVSFDQQNAFDTAAQKFINDHYELYGRKVHVDTYAGQCQSVPPDEQCLIPEMDKIADQYHPYAVIWDTPLCSDCFAELSRRGVVNVGGWGFSESFAQGNAPYHWDLQETGTRAELAFANFWCRQLTSHANGRKVTFAGTQNPAQNFNGKSRLLGVISSNDPDNIYLVKNVLYPALKSRCGESVTHEFFYDQNINTAAQQVQAAMAAMDTATNPATTVLCLCDPVAAPFIYEGEQQNNYYPENVIDSTQWMDTDEVGQTYMANPDGSASLGCPTPSSGCEFDLGLGLSTQGPGEPLNNDAGTRVWHLGGGNGNTPFPSDNATTEWEYFNLLMSMIQATGPNLTPTTMAAAAYKIPPRGGGSTGHYEVSLGPHNHGWISDMRVVYWDKHKKSPVNGNNGSFVQMEGARKEPGDYATLPQPPCPVQGRH